MELFAFRPTGVIAAKELGGDRCALINLMDANLCRTPYGLVNTMLLSLSVQMRFFMPQLNVISKVDIIEPQQLEKMDNWISDTFMLEDAVNQTVVGEKREMALQLIRAIDQLQIYSETLMVSAKQNINVDLLYGKLQLIWKGGEDFQVEDRVVL
jgi:hypothetical protein